jgi:hypothetical protein
MFLLIKCFFMPVQISFTDPTPLPDGFRIGYRQKGSSGDYSYEEFDGVGSPLTLNSVSNFQDYEGTIESLCGGGVFSSEVVPWSTNNFNTQWTVTDEWYVCGVEPCDGRAVYCDWFQVTRESDGFLVFSYTYDWGSRSRTAYMSSLEEGVSYVLEAEWFADDTKTTGFDTVSLMGNATSSSWAESGTGYVYHSITFVGEAEGNVIDIVGTVGASLCTCPSYVEFTLPLSNDLENHCSVAAYTNVFVPNGPGFISPGIQLFTDSGLTTPLTGWSYLSLGDYIYEVDSVTGVVGDATGDYCISA